MRQVPEVTGSTNIGLGDLDAFGTLGLGFLGGAREGVKTSVHRVDRWAADGSGVVIILVFLEG